MQRRTFEGMHTPMILDRLKHETAAAHGAVEAQLDLLGRLGSLDDYRQLLACLWGFYAPFELLLGAGPDWARFDVDIAQRLKAPALARDIQALGLAPAALAALPRPAHAHELCPSAGLHVCARRRHPRRAADRP